jgi:hypothetical protein
MTMPTGPVPSSSSYKHYRDLIEDSSFRTLSMEFEGFTQSEFTTAAADPESAVMLDGENTVTLAAHASRHKLWSNLAYYHSKTSGPTFYYNNLPQLLDSRPEEYVKAMAPVVARLEAEQGLLITDHAHPDKDVLDRDVGYIAAAAGLKVTDLLSTKTGSPRHYMYARQLLRVDRAPANLAPTDLVSEYEIAASTGKFQNERALLRRSLDQAEIDQVWTYYDAAFADLNESDPVIASFSKEEFAEMMRDPTYMKFVYGKNDQCDNVLIVSDVRKFPEIMNQAYYAQRFPEAYQNGNVYYSPCVVSNPKVKSIGMSIATMGLLIKNFVNSSVDPVITLVCDEISQTQVPKLTEMSVNRTGQLVTDFTYPDLTQIFRAFSFTRK